MLTIAASNKTKMILGLKSGSLSKVYISDFGKQNEIKNLSYSDKNRLDQDSMNSMNWLIENFDLVAFQVLKID